MGGAHRRQLAGGFLVVGLVCECVCECVCVCVFVSEFVREGGRVFVHALVSE